MTSKLNIFFILSLLVFFTSCSDDDDNTITETDDLFTIPEEIADYYSGISFDVPAEELKEELATLTEEKHSKILEYYQRHDYLYDATEDPNNPDNVILVYSGESRPKNQYQSGNNTNPTQTFNTEHIYPKSKIAVESGKSDIHNFYPADISINSNRGNDPFVEGEGSFKSTGSGWYPGDDWRGDVARIVMYMNIRYGQSFDKVGNRNLFLEWNAVDPVSVLEVQKNNAVEEAQGNRNPFIDNPYLATLIWGGEADAVNTWTTNYSGPISEEYTESSEEDNGDQGEGEGEGEDDNTDGENQGSENAVLMISEYIEGGSFNKAIEIYNFSDEAADLSAYSLKKQVNGNGEWSDELKLDGTLAAGEVFVVINNQSDLQKLLDEADIEQNGAPIDFNGDDPVGLFNNGTLIDMIGVSGDKDFGKDVTLRRKNTVTGPSTSYDESEWESFDKNTVDNIGTY